MDVVRFDIKAEDTGLCIWFLWQACGNRAGNTTGSQMFQCRLILWKLIQYSSLSTEHL